jgi:septum formation protein
VVFTPASACWTQRRGNARPRSSTCEARSVSFAAEIESYLRSERPYDCTGLSVPEALGIALFERIESDDPTALIGLP